MNAALKKLDDHLSCLFLAVHKVNKHYWKLMVKPTNDALAYVPQAYSLGSLEETEYVFLNSYSAWAESPGAIRASEMPAVLWVAGRPLDLSFPCQMDNFAVYAPLDNPTPGGLSLSNQTNTSF